MALPELSRRVGSTPEAGDAIRNAAELNVMKAYRSSPRRERFILVAPSFFSFLPSYFYLLNFLKAIIQIISAKEEGGMQAGMRVKKSLRGSLRGARSATKQSSTSIFSRKRLLRFARNDW
jgi:hypothetical protein